MFGKRRESTELSEAGAAAPYRPPAASSGGPVYHPHPDVGLTAAQAAQMMEAGYGNEEVASPTKSEKQIIRDNVFTFFNLIFIVLAGCLLVVGAFKDMMFIAVAVANTLIGIIQEIRSKRTIDKLTLLSARQATVVRDGQVMQVDTTALVQDDVAVFAAGSQISADAVILAGEVQVNESLITGEADAVVKHPGDPLLSGSFVVAGTCRAQLTHVGAQSYASRLTLEAKKDAGAGESEMMRSLQRLIRVIGIALIPIGLILFFKQYYFLDLSFRQAMVSMVAALIGMIPEGLYLLTSVALAVSVIRLARRKTLVHDMSCIETLARVDVLCVDKTGTITEPGMQVSGLVPLDEAACPAAQAESILGAFYTAAGADNDTARALCERYTQNPGWEPERIIPFTSATKWSGVSFKGQGAYLVGAPEFILGTGYAALKERVDAFSMQGERVLLLARCDALPQGAVPAGAAAPLALIRIANRIRPEAPETFRYFAEQGVAIKVISGDNPMTVSQVALRAGIADAGRYVDASTLQDDEAIEKAVEEYTVFGRVTPNQKRAFVKALQKAGHHVAMTGDGVNDVLALKDADIGIAMASGSEAACQAAQLVLLESDFSAMPQVVLEGRRVINNIERAASLFLVKNIFSFLLAIITVFVSIPYPVVPMQLTLISAFTIGIPSFFLALEPNKSLVKGRFMPNVLRHAFPGGLAALFAIVGVEAFAYAFDFSTASLSTIAALVLSVNGMLVLYQVCKPFDWKRRIIWGAMAVSMTVLVFAFGSFFSLSPLDLQGWLVLAVFLLLLYPATRMVMWVFGWYERSWRWIRQKIHALSDRLD